MLPMDLNDKQNLLINEQERNVILLASAGTGKRIPYRREFLK